MSQFRPIMSYLRILEQRSGHALGFFGHFETWSDWFLVVFCLCKLPRLHPAFHSKYLWIRQRHLLAQSTAPMSICFEHFNQCFCKNARKVCSGPLSLDSYHLLLRKSHRPGQYVTGCVQPCQHKAAMLGRNSVATKHIVQHVLLLLRFLIIACS